MTDSCASSSLFISLIIKIVICTIPLQSIPKSGTERGWVHMGTEKKSSGPFQKQAQKLGDTEKWPRNWKDMISYHSVLM